MCLWILWGRGVFLVPVDTRRVFCYFRVFLPSFERNYFPGLYKSILFMSFYFHFIFISFTYFWQACSLLVTLSPFSVSIEIYLEMLSSGHFVISTTTKINLSVTLVCIVIAARKKRISWSSMSESCVSTGLVSPCHPNFPVKRKEKK